MEQIGERNRRIFAVAAAVTTIGNIVSAFGLFYVNALFRALACDSGCKTTSSDWSDHPGSWQWNLLLSLSLATSVAAIVLAGAAAVMFARTGTRRRTGSLLTALLTIPPLLVEIGAISGVLALLAQTHRHVDIQRSLALLVVTTSTALVWSLFRARRAA